jgi:succinyl-CoA synthetase beta subunit
MARLHEYQGKAILAANGFKIPRGRAASNADEAVAAAKESGGEVVIKIQAWTTGRAGIGGVAFAKEPEDVRPHAERMLSMKVGQFPVEAVLVEEKVDIDREFFLSFAIDDAARAPMIIFAGGGGTGIEARAAATRRIPCDVNRGPLDSAVKKLSVRVDFRVHMRLNSPIPSKDCLPRHAASKRVRWRLILWC